MFRFGIQELEAPDVYVMRIYYTLPSCFHINNVEKHFQQLFSFIGKNRIFEENDCKLLFLSQINFLF
jgi:hypothetical protein